MRRLNPSVRPFQRQDWPAVETVCHSSPEAAQWTADSFLNPDTAVDHTWVVELEGSVRGFLTVRHFLDEAEILNLAVSPDSRRTGLATILLQTAFDHFHASNIKRIYLEVRESNAAAISFYERNGFAPFSDRPAYYHDPPENALCLVKKLKV